MAEETAFRGVIEFFDRIGVYDVVLPFLLIFTIIFAVLEKTKIFGTEKIGKEEYTKKNLNAMISFVISFLVVASSKLVAVINEALANIVLLLLVSISFLLLIGSFFSHKEETYLEKGPWRNSFMVLMTLGVILVFMNALGWLKPFWEYLSSYWSGAAVGSIILVAFILIFMWFITGSSKPAKKEEEKKE
ncbi:hypothetical protein ACFLZ7_02855 [Nanoarchaeota archaeon]